MRFVLLACLALLFACQSQSVRVPVNQIVSYPLEGNQFVVLVVQDHGITEDIAKQAALKKAAQITLDRHFHYFAIVSESTIQVAKASESSTPHLSESLYQELLEEEEFGQQSEEEREIVSQETYPATRIVIECYKDNPPSSAYDAHQFLKT